MTSQLLSRIERDFSDIKDIAEGKFGQVVRAKNKLDERYYAIKKICVKDSSEKLEKVLLEVRTLAVLEHRCIVRYYSAWLEKSTSSDDVNSQSSSSAEDNTQSHEGSMKEELNACSNMGVHGDFKVVRKSNSSKDDNQPGASSDADKNVHGKSEESSESDSSPTHSILYIQMEYCTSTLRKWLLDLNGAPQDRLEYKVQLKIKVMFKNILEGVEYIHSQNLIHRDLKPENIFLQVQGDGDTIQVKIGDFGLVKKLMQETENDTCGQNGTPGVGTGLYIAPEVNKGDKYNNKVDIYSLGVILLEMCHPINTVMELVEIIKGVHNDVVPEQLKNHWTTEKDAIKKMLENVNVEKRPSAEELLRSLFHSTEEKEEMNKLQGKIQHLTAELQQEQAERELEEKTLQIKKLQTCKNRIEALLESVTVVPRAIISSLNLLYDCCCVFFNFITRRNQ